MRADLRDPAGLRLETVWQEPIGHGYPSSEKLMGTRSGDTLAADGWACRNQWPGDWGRP